MPSHPSKQDDASLDAARETLRRVFGFAAFREGQEPAVARLLEHRSVLAIFPTGAGKSLCYQLPALLLEGLTLVISPLIALMKDQLDFLLAHGVPAARLDSSLDRAQTQELFNRLQAGSLKILYVSPERLGNERFLHAIRHHRISLLAVDEAHCISEWGHNFRPDYLKIATLARELRVGRVLALTATATPEVARDIARAFGIAEADTVQTGFYRPNLKLCVTPCEPDRRDEILLERLRRRPAGPTIVYVTLQRTAETVAAMLCQQGFEAKPYHAGMETDERHTIQDAFMASDRMIVVATIAFGMGIDKSDIRYIYHYNLPKGLENYAQEIGRSGRDGKTSICELLACAADVVVLENFVYGDTPTPEAVGSLVREVLGRGRAFDVSLIDLSFDHDVRPLVVATLLVYLELEKVIESTGHFYSCFRFQPLRGLPEILARFDAARAEFLRRVVAAAKQGKTWYTLDVDRVSQTIQEPRERIVAALSYLEEQGDLRLEGQGVRQGYRMLRPPQDLNLLCATLSQRFERREMQDVGRVRQVLRYVEHEGCLTQHLLAYFGETRGRCGHCARCQGMPARALPPPNYPAIGVEDAKRVRSLQAEKLPALASARQMARFLCGLTSPATGRARLRGRPEFGIFDAIPFHEVLRFVENLNRTA